MHAFWQHFVTDMSAGDAALLCASFRSIIGVEGQKQSR